MIFSGAPFADLTFSDLPPDAGSGNNTLAAPLGTLTLNGLAASFTQGHSLSAPLGNLTLTGFVPTFNQSVTLVAPLGTLTLSGLAATFVQSSGTNLVAPLGSLNLNGLVPSFTQGNTLSAPLGTLTLNGFAPTFSQTGPNVLAAPLGQLILMGLAATFSQSGGPPPPTGGGIGGGGAVGGGGGWTPVGYRTGGKAVDLEELDTFKKIKRRMGQGRSLAAALKDIDAVDTLADGLPTPRPSVTIGPLVYDEQGELDEIGQKFHDAELKAVMKLLDGIL